MEDRMDATEVFRKFEFVSERTRPRYDLKRAKILFGEFLGGSCGLDVFS